MIRKQFDQAISLYHILLLYATADICPYKECMCFSPNIICDRRHLQVIPEMISSNTTGLKSLLLGENNITSIANRNLIPNLTSLDVEDNPITNIDDAAFDGSADTLIELLLSNFRFTRIPDALGHLDALQTLSISRANITDWNTAVWTNISQTLQSLNLHNVSMTSWPVWTQHFTSLQTLSLDIGSISSIPDNAFDTMINTLTTLSMNSNKLTNIPKALSKLKSLSMLHLEENRITDIQWFPLNSKLFYVDFSNNDISDAVKLSQVLRPYEISLSSFGIQYNHLTSIPDFSNFSKIEILDLSNNRISDPTSGAVPANVNVIDISYNSLLSVPTLFSTQYSVSDIVLAYNSIQLLHEEDFHNQTTWIDLSYNNITQLSDTSFPDQFGVLYLNLNGNPLVYISPVVLKRLIRLSQLNINHSRLTRLPLALAYLSKLPLVDLSDSPDLVCTCTESSLRPWVMNLGQYKVVGNCGDTTIYDFFSVLSLSCPI